MCYLLWFLVVLLEARTVFEKNAQYHAFYNCLQTLGSQFYAHWQHISSFPACPQVIVRVPCNSSVLWKTCWKAVTWKLAHCVSCFAAQSLDFHDLTGRWCIKGCGKVLRIGEQLGLQSQADSRGSVRLPGEWSRTRALSRKYACSNSQYGEGGATFLAWMLYCCEDPVKGLQGLLGAVTRNHTPHSPLTVAKPSQNQLLSLWPPVLFWKQNLLPPAVHYSTASNTRLQLIFQFYFVVRCNNPLIEAEETA